MVFADVDSVGTHLDGQGDLADHVARVRATMPPPRGSHGRLQPSFNPAVVNLDENVGIAYGTGADRRKVAERWKVTREEQDAFATGSHRRAIAAQQAGFFDAETTPIDIRSAYTNLETGE